MNTNKEDQSNEIIFKNDDTYGLLGSSIDESKIPKIILPPKAPDGRIPTLNKQGYMNPALCEISLDFINYSSEQTLPSLDGGAAYGIASIPALKKGAKVIVNDSCKNHLFYILKESGLTQEEKARLYLKPGLLPDGITFKPDSLSSVHLARVMHFFKPLEIEKMFENCKKWIVKGGRLYIIIMSPWHHGGEENLAVAYEKKFKEGNLWPGEINDFTINSGQQYKGNTSEYLHCIDPRVMMRLASKYDFIVKKMVINGGPNDMDYTGAILINNK